MRFILLLLFLVSCGKNNNSDSILTERLNDPYIPVAQAKILITQNNGVVKFNLLNFNAYAQTANVTYVLAPSSTLTINATGLSPILNGDVLDIGSLTITDVSTNNLRVCGGLKCNQAALRVYTQELSGFAGLSGMVNTTDGYSVPVTTNLASVGLSSVNAANLQVISIPTNKNRIRLSDFTNLTHEFEADFSNAGVGSYQMVLVIELGLARI